MAGPENFAMNVNVTPVANMEVAMSPGNVIVSVDGEVCFAIKI